MQFDSSETVNTAFNICGLSEKNDILISNDAWMQSRTDIKVTSIGDKLRGNHVSKDEMLEVTNF